MRNLLAVTWLSLAAVGILAAPTSADAYHREPDRVYVSSNEDSGNAVIAFERDGEGQLERIGAFATGGIGSGAGLGSQGAVVLSQDGRWLYAVNAGSNDISVFGVWGAGLWLFDRVDSGGERPVSVTERHGLVYVLNAGGTGNVSGFNLTRRGLRPLADSTQPLSSDAAAAAQVSFSPSGRTLLVTERATHRILSYPIDWYGRAGKPVVHASAGETPFGFAFASRRDQWGYLDYLLVSEAAGGAPGASTISSYRQRGTDLTVISGAVPTNQSAACWVVSTSDGRFAYTTNTGSGNITGFAVDRNGSLAPLDEDGVTGNTGEGSGPIDAAITRRDRFLYVLNGGTHNIGIFHIGRGGSLTNVGEVGGLPPSAAGMAAR